MPPERSLRTCANPGCGAVLEDDEVDFRDGLCFECWLEKRRDDAL